ncbi:Flp family type IVb pilin [Tersicoccus sp. MR15.9]|uniref:Flp family type IVb pilin n=1 Tax=Tersicoccus mangrovi TaxID=3121635 RepID=UPI002FE5B4B6
MVKFIATLSTLGFTFQQRLRREETGATAVEYALLVGLIAVLLVAGLVGFGPALRDFFQGLPARIGING